MWDGFDCHTKCLKAYGLKTIGSVFLCGSVWNWSQLCFGKDFHLSRTYYEVFLALKTTTRFSSFRLLSGVCTVAVLMILHKYPEFVFSFLSFVFLTLAIIYKQSLSGLTSVLFIEVVDISNASNIYEQNSKTMVIAHPVI